MSLVDHVAAGLGVLGLDESLARGMDTAADAVARLDDGDGGAPRGEIAGRAETGESAARDQHRNSAEISRQVVPASASSCINFSGKARTPADKLWCMLSAVVVAMLAGASYAHPEQLVDTAWVAAHSADANVRIVDMRRGGYEAGHVPGAVYLQPEAIRDAKNAADVSADAGRRSSR